MDGIINSPNLVSSFFQSNHNIRTRSPACLQYREFHFYLSQTLGFKKNAFSVTFLIII